MNTHNTTTELISFRYIISINDYLRMIDPQHRQMCYVWVGGFEQIYKTTLFILERNHMSSKHTVDSFITAMYEYLTPLELENVRRLIWVLAEVLQINLVPLLAYSGTTLSDVNLVSVHEQIIEEYSCANTFFIFLHKSRVDPSSICTPAPVVYTRTPAESTLLNSYY